jgi:hypothetical protein
MATAPAAFAAGTEPGKTASISFTFEGIYGIDGTFSYSDASILSDISYSDNGSMTGKVHNDVAYFYGSEAVNFTITVKAKVAASAKNGDTCKVTFTYRTSDENGNMSGWNTVTETITVKVHTCADNNKDHKCDSCGKTLTSCKDANDDHKCDVCAAVLSACADSDNDLKCDVCGGAMKAPVDYSKLRAALENAKNVGEEPVAGLIERLIAAVEKANAALKSDDQATVDAAATELEAVIAELEQALSEMKETVTVEKEVLVEVEPTTPFCSVSLHNILLILLIVSALLNVALVVLMIKKKK